MATNCYPDEFPIVVCTDGPVNETTTALLTVQLSGSHDLASSTLIGMKAGWTGAAEVFTGWANASWSGCDVLSASVTVTLMGTNMVKVDVAVTVSNCPDNTSGDIYDTCGGPGPHTFTDSKVVPLTIGVPCPS